MTTFESLLERITPLLQQEVEPIAELRLALLDIEEFLHSPDFESLLPEERTRLLDLRRQIKGRLGLSGGEPEKALSVNATPSTPSPNASGGSGRNPLAEQQMEEAEQLFYSGRYAEAIRLFDRVIQLEPNWERPKQHRSEAENYLRTGYIPPIALPPEAASAFGRAQSAARVGRYTDALNLLNRAQSILRDLGIQRWQEGMEFEQKLHESIAAESAYHEGMQLFQQGNIEEAIERIETAARATGLPKYGDRAQSLRRLKETLRALSEALSATQLDHKTVAQAKADLDVLFTEYGENPALLRLRSRLEAVIPRAIAPLREQAQVLKAHAERATRLEEALSLARQAKAHLDQIRNFEVLDDDLERLSLELDRQIQNGIRFQDELNQAAAYLENRRWWPVQAARLLSEVRQNYPNDPMVVRLQRALIPYRLLRLSLWVFFVLAIVALVGFGLWSASHRVRAYFLSLTPSPTATLTATATATATSTPTATATATPTFTPLPTWTPTPMLGITLRDIWVRRGCYDRFEAVGSIPSGRVVRFLPAERRFDSFNRECVLVEYQDPQRPILGWVLLVDLSAATITPTP